MNSDPIASFERELRGLAGFLIREGLADEVRLNLSRISVRRELIRLQSGYWPSAPKAALRVPYSELYQLYRDAGAYDIRMLDGALLQFQYEFDRAGVPQRSIHRFLPSPDLMPYQTDPKLYIRDELFADVVGPTAVGVPLRFDFDNRSGVAVEGLHPVSHVTLGQYPNCRVAATGAVTPYYFVEFLLRAFYRTETVTYTDRLPAPLVTPSLTIASSERQYLHIGLEASGA